MGEIDSGEKIETKIDEILKWTEKGTITVKDLKNRYGLNNSEAHKLLDILTESELVKVSYSLFSFDRTKIIHFNNKDKKIKKEEMPEEEIIQIIGENLSELNKRFDRNTKNILKTLETSKKRAGKAKKEKKNLGKIEKELNNMQKKVEEINKEIINFKDFIKKRK